MFVLWLVLPVELEEIPGYGKYKGLLRGQYDKVSTWQILRFIGLCSEKTSLIDSDEDYVAKGISYIDKVVQQKYPNSYITNAFKHSRFIEAIELQDRLERKGSSPRRDEIDNFYYAMRGNIRYRTLGGPTIQ